MKKQNVHAIIELGSGTIKFLAGSIHNNKPIVYKSIIKRTSSEGFKDGKIINPKEVASNIKSALADVKKSLKVDITTVSLSVPPEGINLIQASGAVRINNEEKIIDSTIIRNAVDHASSNVDQIENVVVFSQPQSAYVDGQLQDVKNLSGIKGQELVVNTNVYTLPKVVYDKYKYTLGLAGLDAFNINTSPIAISRELALDSNGISVLLDIGHHKTYVSIFAKAKLFKSHTINWAGKHITFEIDKLMGVNNYGVSSTWKHKHTKLGEQNHTLLHVDDNGKKWTVTDLNMIAARNLKKIVLEIKQILMTEKIENEEIDFVVTGGTANIINIDKFIKHFLKQNVRVYKPTTIGARKPEFTAMLGMLYSADRFSKQIKLKDAEAKSLDISGWFKSEKKKYVLLTKFKKIMEKKG